MARPKKQAAPAADYTLVQEDPPRRAHRSPLYLNMVECTKTPGSWHRIAKYKNANSANTVVSEIRAGKRAKPPGEWEFKSGELPDTTEHGLWAKYVGPAPTE